MDAEFRAWTEAQDTTLARLAATQQQGNDQLVLINRELANIAMMLAPKISEGPSPLEQLLAQIVAQGQESLGHLRDLVQQGQRIEAKLSGDAPPASHSPNGNGKATRQ